jgi:hypothetical protein
MNRKEKRKDKKNRQVYKEVKNENSEFDGMIKILIGVLIVFFVVYFAYAVANGEFASKKDEDPVAAEFQDIFILAGTTFGMEKDDYYVMYYDLSDNYSSALGALYEGYTKSDSETKMYLVDLKNKFNQSYVLGEDETINPSPNNIDELKVMNPTLVRVKDKKVIEFITGRDKISEYIFRVIEESKIEE